MATNFVIGRTLMIAFAAHLSKATVTVPKLRHYQDLWARQSICTVANYHTETKGRSVIRYCSTNGSNEDFAWSDVGTSELNEMISNNDIQLIDVREPYELIEDGRIPVSINIPLGVVGEALTLSDEEFESQYGIPKPSKDDSNIIFHCRSGIRSRTALEIAYQARHYYPGYLGWQEFIDEPKM